MKYVDYHFKYAKYHIFQKLTDNFHWAFIINVG